jgi:type IV pilus assembly protein PilC
MVLFRRLGVAELIELCRALRYGLGAGIMLREVMDLLAARGTRRVRALAGEISKELRSGWSLQDALAKHQRTLPPLFISLATVGEESGNLPEVFGEMERYYVLQQKLSREFREQIAGPLLQFTAAILVVALLIYIMGLLPPIPGPEGGNKPLDPLGLGLSGPRGALVFLGSVCGILAAAAALFYLVRRLMSRRAVVERVLLLVPGIGPCLQALAITRFCIAGRLMFETSLSVVKTLRLAFLATDNPAFVAVSPRVEASLRQGNSINTSFSRANIFPEKFLSAVGMGEESGRLPEAFRHQAEEYDDEARRRLGWLTRLGSWLVWLGVAVVIVTCIFRIFTHAYLANLERVITR